LWNVDGDQKPTALDLLEDRMAEHIEMPPLQGRGYTRDDYKNALLQAWSRREEEIRRIADVA